MKYFTILTRGRTGSTPIIDALNNIEGIRCYQEIFRGIVDYSGDFLDSMRRALWSSNAVDFNELFEKHEDAILPYIFFHEVFKIYDLEEYFNYLEARSAKGKIFKKYPEYLGFKILFNHLEHFESEKLLENLIKRNCAFFLLRRKNIVKEAISGSIAAKRSLYNVHIKDAVNNQSLKSQSDKKFVLSAEEIYTQTQYIEYNIHRFEEMLRNNGASYKIIYYEDFVEDPKSFFSDVLSFLGYKGNFKIKTNYQKVLPEDLSKVIENYDELKKGLELQGLHQPF